MRALLEEVKARGDPKVNDQSIAGLLLKLRDPKTGALRLTDCIFREHVLVVQTGPTAEWIRTQMLRCVMPC